MRRAFKKQIDPARSLSFSYLSGGVVELAQRPISQFDMTVNEVCSECNQGWLNDLENQVSPALDDLLVNWNTLSMSQYEAQTLGYWAFVRALLITHMSPKGRAPRKLLENTYRNRRVGKGCFVQIGVSTHYVWEAGAHQSLTIVDGESHYLGYVAFGLAGLVFLIAISDGSAEGSRRALDTIRRPRLWFPDSFRWLAPPEARHRSAPVRVLNGREAQIAGVSLALRMGVARPLDQFGTEIDPTAVIPEQFLNSLAWGDAKVES